MAILNITYNGLSADVPHPVDQRLSDEEIRRVATEVVRGGDVPGLPVRRLPRNAFQYFVVDRFNGSDGQVRIYLRPKVPFGDR